MKFFTDENLLLAEEIIGRYPKPRSAMIPLLHLAQEQEGWVTDEAMAEIAELAGDLMKHAELRLGVKSGSTTADGMFTLEGAECQAACTEAPCLQVNYRHQYKVTANQFDALVEELGSSDHEVPEHGVLAQVRQHIPEDRFVGVVPPEDVTTAPVWLNDNGSDQ